MILCGAPAGPFWQNHSDTFSSAMLDGGADEPGHGPGAAEDGPGDSESRPDGALDGTGSGMDLQRLETARPEMGDAEKGIAGCGIPYYHSSMTTITCKIPERLDAELEAVARRRRVPKSTIVREALEQRLKRDRKVTALTAYDLAKSVCGTLRGPSDLATNPRYMEGFGA